MTLLRTISIAFTAVALFTSRGESQAVSWAGVDSILGRAGAAQSSGVVRYGFPRTDLSVTANGVKLKPGFALGSWVAFKRGDGDAMAMAMGDLVLTESEVGPVMKELQSGGVMQTALHNHVLGESPRIMYMHIEGHGDERSIASAIRRALGQTKTPMSPATQSPPAPIDLDTAAIATAMGYHGKVNGGVFQVSVPRADKITENGMEVPASMGLATAINFQPTGNGNAAITGDFVMTAGEVNKVIRALQANGIQPTALHSHMLDESPRLFFMHFWANANAVTLAKGLRSALAEMNVTR
ncbi:MAG TPA: DUF1259 domain-containing protein [Gemmatimonadaceae bacterium]